MTFPSYKMPSIHPHCQFRPSQHLQDIWIFKNNVQKYLNREKTFFQRQLDNIARIVWFRKGMLELFTEIIIELFRKGMLELCLSLAYYTVYANIL